MNSRGQGISINVVVIAAIALIILIVLAVLVFRSSKGVGDQTGSGSCLANAGSCMLEGVAEGMCPGPNNDYAQVDRTNPKMNCKVTGEVCCRYMFGG